MTKRDENPSEPSESVRPRALVTSILFCANLAVFGWMLASGDHVRTWSVDYLLAWGANYAPLTIDGQWWRLFTCLFVHAGSLHLAFNLWVLWQLGRLLESLIGSASFLILYLASGLCSSMAGLWCSPFAVVQGASGALLGLVGGLSAFLMINRRNIPSEASKKLRNNILIFLGLNLVLGLFLEQIDLVGHTFGLLAGIVFGLPLMQPASSCGPWAKCRRRGLAAGLAGALLLSAASAMPSAPPDFYRELVRFTAVEQECLSRYNAAYHKYQQGKLSKRAFVDLVDGELLPKWHAAGQKVKTIDRCPATLEQIKPKLNSYIEARQESWTLLVTGIRESNKRKLSLHHETWTAAEAIARELSAQR